MIARTVTESYIVRIYRRDAARPQVLHGAIKKIGAAGQPAIHYVEHPWRVLSASPKQRRNKGAGRQPSAYSSGGSGD